jgi:hypothetical protein
LAHIHKQQTGASAPAQQTPRPTAPTKSPSESLLQTGFHPAAKAKPQTAAHVDPTAPAGGTMTPNMPHSMPHAPAPAMAQGQAAPTGGLSLGSAIPMGNANQEMQQPQMQQPQMQQVQQQQPRMQQPQMQQMQPQQTQRPQMQQQPEMQVAPAMQQVAAPPAPVQAAPSQAQRMQPETSSAPARPAKAARSFPTPATPSSRHARPTPKSKPSSRSAVITTVIVVASVGLGAALGSFILSLF